MSGLRRPYELLSRGVVTDAAELTETRRRVLASRALKHASARLDAGWLALYAARHDRENAEKFKSVAEQDWRSVVHCPKSGRGSPPILWLNAQKNLLLADVLADPTHLPSSEQRHKVAEGLGKIARRTVMLIKNTTDPNEVSDLRGSLSETAFLQLFWRPVTSEMEGHYLWAAPASPAEDHDEFEIYRTDINVYSSPDLIGGRVVPLQIKTSKQDNSLPLNPFVIPCYGNELTAPSHANSGASKVAYTSESCRREASGEELSERRLQCLEQSTVNITAKVLAYNAA